MEQRSKADVAWDELIEKYDIINRIDKDGVFEISATEINEYRQARLMTKFDFKADLPKKFASHHISILPNTRGTYVLGHFAAYETLNHEEQTPINIPMNSWVRSFDQFPVTSESVALNVAQMTKMIDIVLDNNNDSELSAVSTLTGRLKSGVISFDVDMTGKKKGQQYHFEVENSQLEIDGGFETPDKLAVIEAKSKVPKDFMIRQLYYPYRLFDSLDTGKPVIPIFFTHADDIYSFHIYKFNQLYNYSSIEKVKQVSFIIDQVLDIELSTVKEISDASANKKITNVTFPQADSFSNLMAIVNFMETAKTKHEIADFLGYDDRQGDYYGNALRYLGLANKVGRGDPFTLTKLGHEVRKLPNSNRRNLILIKQILGNKAFNDIFKSVLQTGDFDDNLIIKAIEESGGISKDTLRRRKSTARNYISWILNIATAE